MHLVYMLKPYGNEAQALETFKWNELQESRDENSEPKARNEMAISIYLIDNPKK